MSPETENFFWETLFQVQKSLEFSKHLPLHDYEDLVQDAYIEVLETCKRLDLFEVNYVTKKLRWIYWGKLRTHRRRTSILLQNIDAYEEFLSGDSNNHTTIESNLYAKEVFETLSKKLDSLSEASFENVMLFLFLEYNQIKNKELMGYNLKKNHLLPQEFTKKLGEEKIYLSIKRNQNINTDDLRKRKSKGKQITQDLLAVDR